MGTVGLEDRTGRLWQARVVDIHVPSNPRGWEVPDEEQIYRTVELTAMSMNFRKTVFLYGGSHSLPSFAGLALEELEELEINKDSYRADKINRRDFAKIDYLKKVLEK